ncbi:actin-related protein Arp2/3 complex, subunit ARPC4 [Moesziomyces antarcticus T-34]|uniref:Actin-related protein Arp2/3 complex, subunit ARPC4 n=1 Tax=Pseudozyma antarctica (strain T-34) TaxID=1151754 RepID=M9LRQ1_PSEA3|nr:actin-related protein Arp2/3 complex, subunit ARPC4 [Moesziomyces antarcticus T-34]
MLKASVALLALASSLVGARSTSRRPLSYAPEPQDVYVAPTNMSTTTLLDFVKSRPELSTLLGHLQQSAGFEKAFQTEPTWAFTFFAPSNDAFENLGEYYRSFLATPRGKWWFGNQIMSHYVPNTCHAPSPKSCLIGACELRREFFGDGASSEMTPNGVGEIAGNALPSAYVGDVGLRSSEGAG